jgi:hypothetical protein
MNMLFKLSERLDRFCEILIATDELRELRVRAAWLTLKLSHMTHPHVRTRMVHCTSSNGMTNTVVSAINMTTGQTIVLVSRMRELAEKKAEQNWKDGEYVAAKAPLDIVQLQKILEGHDSCRETKERQ